MANTEHLKILESGVEQWNEWRGENQEVSPDLRDAYLDGADLCGADLSGANLEGAYLEGAYLDGADLSEADLSRAILSRADLTKATLTKATLHGADLSGGYMSEAELSGAYLNEANLRETNLSGANLKEADLSGADLSEACLRETDLSGADLTKADLSGADLSGANLSEADLSGANLSEADLSEANLSETRLNRTVLGLTDLNSCKSLHNVIVSGPRIIDLTTLRTSKNLPKEFLTKLGIPDSLIDYLPDFYDPALRIYPAFLSHSWADKDFVRKLYEALTKKGVTTWLDEKKMKPGDNIHDSIGDAIKYYDKLILVCSESTLNSWWVEKELERVYEKERELQKERGKKFRLVIPIRIDDSILGWKDGVAATVKSSVIGDFTKWQDDVEFDKAVKDLVDALNAGRVDIKPPSFL